MKKDMKKFKNLYLEELISNESIKTEIKNKIGIKKQEDSKVKNNDKVLLNKRKGLILSGSFVLLILIALVTTFSIISYRNTPVYKGMDAENIPIINNKNKNFYRHIDINRYKEHEDHTNNKYGDKFDNIVNDLVNEIGIVINDEIVCYAKPLEEIIITIEIDNPKFYEILSFTLNGKLYQTYEFVEGSDSSNIRVKFTVQETSGIQEITIDAIKYIDNTTIKNVRFDGNRTIKLGVTYTNVPNVANVNENLYGNNLSLTFNVSDFDKIINVSNDLNIYLLDSESIVETRKLKLGENSIEFTNLKYGTTYLYIIIGVFDIFDGSNNKAYNLYQNYFTTIDGFDFESVTVDYDSLSISYSKYENIDGMVTNAKVYQGETLIQTIDTNLDNLVISDLMSNYEYRIELTYEYSIMQNGVKEHYTNTISEKYKTLERPVPTIDIINEIITNDSIAFDLNISDTTNIGKIVKIDIYNKESLVYTFNEKPEIFTGLLSDNDYKFIITYEYDLLDGNGLKTIEKVVNYHTQSLEIPTVIIYNAVAIMGNVMIWVEVKDLNNVLDLSSITIKVYLDNELVRSINEFNTFEEISEKDGYYDGYLNISELSSGDYIIYVNYKYDLKDGNGEVTVDENHETADNSIGIIVD